MAPNTKNTPLHNCTPMKSIRPFLVLRRAPAIGAPMSEAMLDTLQDMPKRVPRRDKSGLMFAKAAEGRVTSAADKKPERF